MGGGLGQRGIDKGLPHTRNVSNTSTMSFRYEQQSQKWVWANELQSTRRLSNYTTFH